MKLLESKAELVPQQESLEGIYKQIELCGRTCYKSTDRITENSAKPFVDRLIRSNHTAVLEHGTVYLYISYKNDDIGEKYSRNPYSRVLKVYHHTEGNSRNTQYFFDYYITSNLRVLVENNWLEDLEYLCEPSAHHERRYTIKFTTDRGVMAELTRHRAFSFSIESTRYCNYTKSKFNSELTFIKPSWGYNKTAVNANGIPYNGVPQFDGDYFEDYLREAERIYFKLIKEYNWTPQQARQVLPHALKTEVCMTGFTSDWKAFFDLRYFGRTGKPHPDMELLANKARRELIKAGVWDSIMES